MPSVRRSTGRAVTPVRQPEVASAKQTQLNAPPMVAFPLSSDLVIGIEQETLAMPARLVSPTPFVIELEALEAPPIDRPTSRLEPDGPIATLTEPFPAMQPTGVCWTSRGQPSATAAADEDLRFLRAMRPRLAAGLLDQEAVLPSFPAPIRADQQSTIQRLLDEPDLILLADPGSGMEATAALALRELFRSHRIHRALLLAPTEMLAPWRTTLLQWAGELTTQPGAVDGGTWPEGVDVWLGDPQRAVAAVRTPVETANLACDVVVLASFTALRRRGFDPMSLAAFPAQHHWVMTGGPPPEAEDWRLLHRYLHPEWAGPAALADIQERLRRQTVRQTKAMLQAELPRRSRIELWFELEGEQRADYQRALADEQLRLERLGGAVNRTQISAALGRLKRTLAFRPGTLDGVKVRALVDLTEEILASGSKLIVVAPPDDEMLAAMLRVLEAYGAVRLDSAATAESQASAVAEFRRLPSRRVLVADSEARGDGEPLNDATYLIHFSHDWNPAHRRRAEQRLFPDLGPGPALTLYEFWTADSVEARYYRLLESQGLLARDVALETRPKDIEERLTLQHWMRDVFGIGTEEASPRAGRTGGTGQLPGTGDLRKAWASFDVEGLASAAESLIRALGFTQIERLGAAHESGCDFLGWVTSTAGAERVFLRCLRQDADVDVGAGQAVLAELERRPDCVGAYLIATAAFTPACRRLAESGEGRLVLVDGSEFFRHLRVLGLVG